MRIDCLPNWTLYETTGGRTGDLIRRSEVNDKKREHDSIIRKLIPTNNDLRPDHITNISLYPIDVTCLHHVPVPMHH
jgi:hypothetical protein